jgi:hypothetical protein
LASPVTVKVPFTGTGHHASGGFTMDLMGSTPTGCKAQGPGEIVGTKFAGSFVIASCPGSPAVTIAYKTTKK